MADRTILHSDINCCYASIELLHHPELRGKPVAVGGSYLSTAYYNSISDNFGYRNRLDDISLDDPEARQGIVLTADYIAKKCGVKTGMPLWEAKRVCPEITFIPLHMDLYLRFSRMAHEIYAEYTDLQEPYGIDESWLDVTASATLKGDGEQIAKEISNRMKSELGITVSIGVSFNKIFAKLGSDYKKPDAITTMYRHEYREKAWVLPASDLLFVGRSTEKRLAKIGIYMIGDIARADEKTLHYALGKHGDMLWAYANGLDESPVKYENTHAPIKSIGNSTTTHRELVNDDDVKVIVYVIAESVAARLRENGFKCNVVEISVRDSSLVTYTRQRKLDRATYITQEIAEMAYRLFKESYRWEKPVRSIGIRGADLVADGVCEQLSMFIDEGKRHRLEVVDRAVDDIRHRFGFYSIQRGVMYTDAALSHLNAKEEHIVHPHGCI